MMADGRASVGILARPSRVSEKRRDKRTEEDEEAGAESAEGASLSTKKREDGCGWDRQ